MSSFTDPLQIEPIPGTEFWKILRDMEYDAGREGSGETYLVPRDFVTDGGSIPALLQPLVGPPLASDAAAGYALHDWLYRTRGLQRAPLMAHPDFRRDVSLLEGALHNDAQNWCGPQGEMTRQRADTLLWEAMGVTGAGRVKRWLVYYGLRVGGWVAWNKYRNDQANSCAEKEAA